MKPAVLEHLPWRIAGVVALAVLVVLYQPETGGAVNGVVIPMAMALATWLLVQKVVAVALGAGLLAAIHSAPGSGDWVVGIAYPALAATCALILVLVLGSRFRRHMAATHEARWRHRRQQDEDS
ncbi:MAG: hypothetical protein RIC56_00745 [Pseudomonadales bacterium]